MGDCKVHKISFYYVGAIGQDFKKSYLFYYLITKKRRTRIRKLLPILMNIFYASTTQTRIK